MDSQQNPAENPAWKCRHKPSSESRNLIVCIDGTANQFGQKNTNVIELYNLIEKEAKHKQLTWYNSGIGTYARPSRRSLQFYLKVFDHKIDLAIAWNFERTILAAYRWLSDNYQEGDRIYLFGFSRGAFQVRVLAGMIDKVGLIHKGNDEQIPFAFELYADPESDKVVGGEKEQKGAVGFQGMTEASISMAARFKKTFSHDDASVHYVGVWDTVSSIGLVRGQLMLPRTVDGMKHVCFFRHALALDERRVKFAPEYAYGGSASPPHEEKVSPPKELLSSNQNLNNDAAPQTLEVWFAGTHSDIGGGNVRNEALDRSRPPLRWMVFESSAAGLRTKPFQRILSSTEQIEVKESLTGIWWALEGLPLGRLTYTRREKGKQMTHKPHLGAARKIHLGQKIHGSLILSDRGEKYTPIARLPEDTTLPGSWNDLRTRGLGDWKAIDLFEGTQDLLNRFIDKKDGNVWELLRRTAMTVDGRQAMYEASVRSLQTKFKIPTLASDIKVDFLVNVTDILHQTQRREAPLRKFDLEDVKEQLTDPRESENETYATIARKFARSFTKFVGGPSLEVVGGGPLLPIPSAMSFPDGKRIVSGSLNGTMRVWDVSANPQVPVEVVLRGDASVVSVVAVSPKGGLVVSGSQKGTVRFWDTESNIMLQAIEGHSAAVRSIAFSPDGRWAASGSEDNTVRLWDVDNRTYVGEPLAGHSSTVYAVCFIDRGRRVASCSIDRTVRIWDFATGKLVGDPMELRVGQEDWLLSAAFSSDGTLVAAGFSNETVHIWDLKTREEVGKPFNIHKAVVSSIGFSPDGTKVVSASVDGMVFIWAVGSLQLEGTFQHRDWVRSISFFPDGERVLSGCDDGKIRIWATEPW